MGVLGRAEAEPKKGKQAKSGRAKNHKWAAGGLVAARLVRRRGGLRRHTLVGSVGGGGAPATATATATATAISIRFDADAVRGRGDDGRGCFGSSVALLVRLHRRFCPADLLRAGLAGTRGGRARTMARR